MPDNRLPTNQSQLDIVEKLDEIKDAIAQGGGGGTGGHTIIDENGNSMTARSGLQFFGAVEVTDDSSNNRTLVEILGGDFYNPVIYSLEEREIGVWTDGKPLYEKTIIWTDASTGNNTLPHGISDVDYIFITDWNFDNVLGFEGTSSNWWAMVYDCNKTNIKYNLGSSWGNSKDLRVTFQYTKTTDVAGSGSWTPQGVPIPWKEVVGTLTAGQTTITLSHSAITANSTVDVYTDSDIDYDSISVSTGSVTITFDAQASNVSVKVRVS